jgi:glycosyltransferase involved in cell wall biosynthesis
VGSVADQVASGLRTERRRPNRPSVSVVIPTLNEAANLPHVFGRLSPGMNELIVVDGHSVDDTVNVAKELRPDARVILQNRRGKGNALACGFAAATGDIIVMLDADGSTDPAEIPRFLNPLVEGADFVKGSRYMMGGGSTDITGLRSAGNKALGASVNVLFGTRYTDLCYGYSAFWRRCLPQLQIDCDGFEVETVLNIRAAKAGLTVIEVPSQEEDRIYGVSNLNAWRDGRRVLKTIVRERFTRLPEPNHEWHPEFDEIMSTLELTAGLGPASREALSA